MVAGETQDDELVGVRGGEFFVEGLETFVLGREATFGGCVDNEDDFAFVFGERDRLAFLCRLGWLADSVLRSSYDVEMDGPMNWR